MRTRICLAMILILVSSGPALAWGPKTQLAILNSASYLLSKEGNIPINRLTKELRAGAMASTTELKAAYPDLETNPVNAIESEMYLLQAVRGPKIDPYFVYRLGVLGQLVAEVSAPLRETNATYRNLYYADVEGHIEGVPLQGGARRPVDPRSYFSEISQEASQYDEAVEQEYKEGIGFSGFASARLQRDASRSVEAVADVWTAVLTSGSVAGGVSESQLRGFVLGAYDFYVRRGNSVEIEAAAGRLDSIVEQTADMKVAIGDMFYDAGMFEKAIAIYTNVLAIAPERREVVERIANYYVQQGETLLASERFEAALDAFTQALDTNPLHLSAESLRIQAESLIADRDGRQMSNQGALQRASDLETMAEQESLRGHYAEAIVLLRQAGDAYAEVSSEFPAEYQQRMRGENTIRMRLEELKGELIANAQIFSGSGYAADFLNVANTQGNELEQEGLRTYLREAFQQEMSELQTELDAALSLD